jgi:hypothetical protein
VNIGDDLPEGLLGGIVGDDNDLPEIEAAETLATAEALAAAVAARLPALVETPGTSSPGLESVQRAGRESPHFRLSNPRRTDVPSLFVSIRQSSQRASLLLR